MMMKIKEYKIRKFNRKTREYDRVVNVFEKYKIGRVETGKVGRRIEIIGPKQTFVLCECAKPLTVIAPPVEEGGNAVQKKLALFFVTSDKGMFGGISKIQGADYFALENDVLIPYRKDGRGGFVSEMGK